jgi:hypothetical protein
MERVLSGILGRLSAAAEHVFLRSAAIAPPENDYGSQKYGNTTAFAPESPGFYVD